ncbi:transcription antitermination factor NusB [Candidatus Dojkabacteria bacterium]|uniref:Transcription antitermination protein NusB n=1 Tax=Candidatus Dojkabacteria bacterium TaxID=2099670 RepID=A0A955I9H4_9BACT|nr:transcription antitermination factor NusB [Candidatus Dojkabacteria bacterium]
MEDNSNSRTDPRSLARFLAIQYLFTKLQEDKSRVGYNVFEPNALLSIMEEKKYSGKLYEELIDGVEENEKKLDEIIQRFAPAWPLDQINPVDLIVLRVAVFEGFISKLTPVKVVINEAVDLSKALSSEKSGKFVNGVLGAILNNEKLPDGPESK